MPHRSSPTLVIGGGLAGLATAAYLARAGRAVRLLERTDQLGGRAATRVVSGFHFNLGPHALYARGHARRVFAELGVAVEGRMPSQRGLVALDKGRRHLLPTGPGALLRTRLLGWRDKLETLRFLAGLPRVEAKRFEELTMKQWLERHITGVQVRALVAALIRLTTYTHAPELLGAAAAIRQLQLAVAGNVLYIDDGWQSLVAGLRQSATAAGLGERHRARRRRLDPPELRGVGHSETDGGALPGVGRAGLTRGFAMGGACPNPSTWHLDVGERTIQLSHRPSRAGTPCPSRRS